MRVLERRVDLSLRRVMMSEREMKRSTSSFVQNARPKDSLSDVLFASLTRAFVGRALPRQFEESSRGKKSEAFVPDWPVRHDGE